MGVRTVRPTLVGLVALTLLNCMQERPPINRVQPDFLDKRDFIPVEYQALEQGAAPGSLSPALLAQEPVFYTQTTVIAKPTTTGFVGITDYSNTDKIRWEVTEHYLIARQAYEFVRNAPRGATGIGQNPQTGDVAAVFAITSHFDIRRDYNPTTGEEINVVVENATDRPWYQRRYLRVDWSQNLVSGYNSPLQYEEWTGRVSSEPVPVFVNNPQDPNAPTFDYATVGGQRQLQYFDVVNRATLHPETTYYDEEWPTVPVCILGDGGTDCAPAELTFRVAFRRVDTQRDYEPMSLSQPLPGQDPAPAHVTMERFGYFDSLRMGYDQHQHALLDSQRVHYANRHNLWVHHHALAFGAATATRCNRDADCSGDTRCQIGNDPRDDSHRGVCAPLAIVHLPATAGHESERTLLGQDVACATDQDCRVADTGAVVSGTAVCDPATHTCGEHYYRCASSEYCRWKVDPQSTCDLNIAGVRADNRGLCLLPYRQRQVRPIPYYESPNYPDYMQGVTESVVTEWNSVFVDTVGAARQHECEIEHRIDAAAAEPGAAPCGTPAVRGTDPRLGADAAHIFIGCHAPVWGTDRTKPGFHTQADVDRAHGLGWDLEACGPQGTLARLGDLRYNMIGSIVDHDAQGYWGLANIAADPETGEMIAGRGAVWQTITDYYGSYVVQLVRVLNGDDTPDSVANGQYIVDSMRQLGTGATPGSQVLDAPFRSPGALQQMSTAAAGIQRLQLPDAGWFSARSRLPLFSRDPTQPGARDRALRRLLEGRMLGDGTNRGLARRNALRGTGIESQLMTSQQIRLAPGSDTDPSGVLPETLEAASPFRRQSPALQRAVERLRSQLRSWQCNYEASFSDDIVLGLAQRLMSDRPILQSDPLDRPVAFGRDWNFRTAEGGTNYDLMREYVRLFVHHGVLAHELGHSLGARHNFNASADAINYHDQYWQVRGRGHTSGLRPRYEYLNDPADGHYYSNEEISGRLEEFAYSSVMDYKGYTEDAHGIGRYDRAFVLNGYVGMVEAFRDVANHEMALVYNENVAGSGMSTTMDFHEWTTVGIHGLHYTQIPQIFGTRPDGAPNLGDDNRYWVFEHETTSEEISGWGSPTFTNVTGDGHVLVPYRFDSDERANLIWQDQRNDAGADAYESLHYVGERYLNYYFANSFARLRSGFSTGSYRARMFGRFTDQLRQCAQTLAFDMIWMQDYFANVPGWQRYLTDPREYAGFMNLMAMSEVADTFVAQVTMPEMEIHRRTTQIDGTQLMAQNFDDNQGINIPINAGRYFESNWNNNAGFWWYEQLYRAGSFYDKTMSLDALTDPELLLLGRDTPTDIRLFQLSFYTMFPDQMIRLFGGLLSEDYTDFAPILNLGGDHPILRTHVATLNLPPGTGTGHSGRVIDGTHLPIDPQDHFTVQLWSAVMTITQFPATFDQRYMNFARLWVDGSVESITTEDPARDTVAFTNPWTHETYRALHFGTAAGQPGASVGASPLVHPSLGTTAEEAGIAARMLLHLRDMDTMRLRAVDAGQTARAAQVELQEQKYIDLIHVLRQMTSIYGTGHIVFH